MTSTDKNEHAHRIADSSAIISRSLESCDRSAAEVNRSRKLIERSLRLLRQGFHNIR